MKVNPSCPRLKINIINISKLTNIEKINFKLRKYLMRKTIDRPVMKKLKLL